MKIIIFDIPVVAPNPLPDVPGLTALVEPKLVVPNEVPNPDAFVVPNYAVKKYNIKTV